MKSRFSTIKITNKIPKYIGLTLQGCGSGGGEAVLKRIHLRGCVTTLTTFLDRDIRPALAASLGLCLLLMVTDLALLAVFSAYVVIDNRYGGNDLSKHFVTRFFNLVNALIDLNH